METKATDLRYSVSEKKIKNFFSKKEIYGNSRGDDVTKKHFFSKTFVRTFAEKKKNVNPSSGVKRVFLSFFTGEIFGNKYNFDIRLHDFLSLHTKILLDCYRQQLS